MLYYTLCSYNKFMLYYTLYSYNKFIKLEKNVKKITK